MWDSYVVTRLISSRFLPDSLHTGIGTNQNYLYIIKLKYLFSNGYKYIKLKH